MTHTIPQLDDTITAIATASGPGGIGIVRLSGAQAEGILSQIFCRVNAKKSGPFKSRKVYYGRIIDPQTGAMIDEVLVVLMRAPKSYTREDVVEISCHGGFVAVQAILNLTLKLGARLALPGEFTKRAFLNGRLDLVQAQAVLDIITAKTENALRVSSHQLKGDLTLELEKIRGDLLQAYVHLEALINFPEEGIEERNRSQIAEHLALAKEKINTLLSTSQQGRILREGAKVVLCGRPNVGKSSLLNVLLKQPRAIVSEVAGTTRDTIEESAQIRSIPLELVDTAGILDPRDTIEEQAVGRSHVQMKNADLVLLTFSAAEKLTKEDLRIVQIVEGQNILAVINKSDLTCVLGDQDLQAVLPDCKIIRVSATTKSGIAELEKAIEENILHGQPIDTTHILVNNARHIAALENARQWINESQEFLRDNLSLEFISENLKESLSALDRITGRNADEDLLQDIFSSFCIGK